MAKNKNVDDSTIDVEAQLKKGKKKTLAIVAVVGLLCVGIGVFVGVQMFGGSLAEKAEQKKLLETIALSEYPIEEDTTTYSRDIASSTYMLSDGAIKFEMTLVYYNKLCANLFTGVVDRTQQVKTEPDLSVEDLYGDKLVKNAVNTYLQGKSKAQVSSSEALAAGLTKAINKEFQNEYGEKIISKVLITSHLVQ